MQTQSLPYCVQGAPKLLKSSAEHDVSRPDPECMKHDSHSASSVLTVDSLTPYNTLPYVPQWSSTTACSCNYSDLAFSVETLGTDQAVERWMQQEAASVMVWNDTLYEFEKTLMSAPRNQGRVDRMRCIEQGEFVAVKRMPREWVTSGPDEFEARYPDASERPWFDVGVVRYLHDRAFPHVCEPKGIFMDSEFTYVVTSLATDGDLFSWMDCDLMPGAEREGLVRPVMKEVFTAVRLLHDFGIAHCDLSLENIVLTTDPKSRKKVVKLIDFGAASLRRYGCEIAGKRGYVAPEVFRGNGFDAFLSDAFALGVCLFSLAAHLYPWESTREGACKLFSYMASRGFRAYIQRRRVLNGGGKRLSETFSAPLVDVLDGLLAVRPESRLTLGEQCWNAGKPSILDTEWLKLDAAE